MGIKFLNITGMQKKMFNIHSYTLEKILEIAQALYEKHMNIILLFFY
jgi:DNA topoisomerase IA